jgi:hypothetical protein
VRKERKEFNSELNVVMKGEMPSNITRFKGETKKK